MKYGKITLGQIEAILNKITKFTDGIKRFLADELTLVDPVKFTSFPNPPFPGAVVEEHNTPQDEWKLHNGNLYKNSQGVFLSLEPSQTALSFMKGYDVQKSLKEQGEQTLNASDLDFLLENQELIPENWKGDRVFFWGTTFRDNGGRNYVRILFWDKEWASGFCPVDRGLDNSCFAAILF